MTDQEIDNALDRVLRASGTALRNYSVQKNIQDMRDVMRELLTPVQSGGVVTRETIDCRCMCEKCETRTKETYRLCVNCSNCGWIGEALIRKGDSFSSAKPCPQCGTICLHTKPIPAQTPQPEARGVEEAFRIVWDESAFNAWNDRTYTFEKWLKSGAYYRALAHLQQAPQGMDLNVIESALRFIADRHDTPIIQKNEAQKALLSIRKIPKATIACCATCEFRGVKTSEDGFNHCQKFSVDSDKACFENGYRHWSPAPVKGDDQQKDVQK